MFEVAPSLESTGIIDNRDERLRQVSLPVEQFDAELVNLVNTMAHAMFIHRGQGLAAVQIGVLKRVIIVRQDGNVITSMTNPVITRMGNRFITATEGCLSLPGLRIPVERPAKCDVTWQDTEGNFHSKTFSNNLARCIMHEVDHLDGILITDK